ncbi:MAG: hypothetical protein HY823_15315 [Acidobacteria bacterium]|nr:hypothetical protein [Acidobacteriota bacterium]
MLQRIGEAAKDLAETLRRVFQAPAARAVALDWMPSRGHAWRDFQAWVGPGPDPLVATLGHQASSPTATPRGDSLGFQASLRFENAWGAWSTEARVAAMPVFGARETARLELPPLPRRPRCGGLAAEALGTRGRGFHPALPPPEGRSLAPALRPPTLRRDLDLLLGLPLAVEGEDLRTAPRAVQLRLGLQMVRATGENVRNLELLGAYRIPRKGVRQLRHDGRSGRILLWLETSAAGAERGRLILARRRDDQTLLTCFSEDP